MPSEEDVAEERLVNHLREFRARHRLTQEQLAERVGVTRKTVNTVENGIFIPSTLLALKLARALNVRVDDLFAIDGPPPQYAEDDRVAH